MIEADGIVLASPNYMYNLSAQMKALMDRCHYMCHCQMMVGKYGAVVVTSGGPYTGMAEEYLLRILGIMGCWIVGSICAVKAQFDDEDERNRIMELAAHLGRQIARSIEKREAFPEQVAEREKFFEALKYLVIKQKENWPYEYEYWKTHWGLREDKGISRIKHVGIGRDMNLVENRPY
jgi:multimeric flavodoxin WrbA